MKKYKGKTLERDPLDLKFLKTDYVLRFSSKQVLIAFFDISGFKKWTRLPKVSTRKFGRFMLRVYEEFFKFRNGNGCYLKLTGDGFMAVLELPHDLRRSIAQISSTTKAAYECTKNVDAITVNMADPHPGKSRIRLILGDALRFDFIQKKGRKEIAYDYLGYSVNLADSVCKIKREISCMCDGTVRSVLENSASKKGEISFAEVRGLTNPPEGIELQDWKDFSEFKVLDRVQNRG